MAEKHSFPVQLDDRHMQAVEALCEKRGLTKVGLIRAALRLYQLVDDRAEKGYDLALKERATGKFHTLLVPEFGLGGCMGDD